MSISSSIKHIKAKTKINPKIALLLSFGSVFGGIIGNEIFDLVLNHFNENIVKGVQAVMLTAFIIFALIYVNSKRAKSLHTTNQIAIILIGLFLGFSSAFLGIGGGPINTIFLVLFLSFTFKESVVYSVAIIFFSQLSHLIAIFVNNQFEPYKDYLPIILIAMVVSVLGGIIGSKLNKKLSNKSITKIFTAVMLLVAVINICNAITGLVIN
jgi:hypothetical protein